MVGSANLTWQGLFSHAEACITFDSRTAADVGSIGEVQGWFDSILDRAKEIDMASAIRVFDARPQWFGNQMASNIQAAKRKASSAQCWALKTTSGSYGTDYWDRFQEERVVAIGWADLSVDPSKVNLKALRRALRRTRPHKNPGRAASKIMNFTNMVIGDYVLICRGYPPNSRKDVHIHAIAQVVGPFFDDSSSSWWRFKHKASMQTINQSVPHQVVAKALGKDSLRETIHKLEPARFQALIEVLHKDFGIPITIGPGRVGRASGTVE